MSENEPSLQGGNENLVEETNMEVGEMVLGRKSLSCMLVLLMEDWPDWLAVVAQIKAPLHVFCNWRRVDMRCLLEEGLEPDSWQSVDDFWQHKIVTEPSVCVLVSGSHAFVERAVVHIPEGAPTVAAIAHEGRGLASGHSKRLRWRTIRHQEVGGVTTLRCSIGIPWEWPELRVRRHVRRCVKHVVVHSERPIPLRVGDTVAGLQSIDQLLDYRRLGDEFAMPVRTRKGEAPGRRRLTEMEIGAAFDLPLKLSKDLAEQGISSRFGQSAVSGCPGKILAEALNHLVVQFTGVTDAYQVRQPSVAPESRVRMRAADRPMPEAERNLPDWARVCSDNNKAAKADGARPNFPMWDLRTQEVFPHLSSEFLERFRGRVMNWWRGNTYRSYRNFMRGTYGRDWSDKLTRLRQQGDQAARLSPMDRALLLDGNQGGNVLMQIFGGAGCRNGGSYWDWDAGSALMFWRWHPEIRVDARDGTRIFIQGKLPRYRKPQRVPHDSDQRAVMRDKLWRVRERGYILPGPVVSLTNVFFVPKVIDPETGEVKDWRPVYDATKSGLNAAVWSPSFFMPTADSLFRMMDFDTWLGDIDLGEMFLNFWLDPRIRPYAGVDISGFCTEEEKHGQKVVWERWVRLLMGFRPSPYTTIRQLLWGEEIVRGERSDPKNIFRWERIRLNLPGSPIFDPLLPWVSKVFTDRLEDGELIERIACDFATFVDDMRAAGYSLEATWQAMRVIAARLNYLGIQEAPRKRRSPLKTGSGAWTGALQRVYEALIAALTSQEKWDKGKRIIRGLLEQVRGGLGLVLKALLKDRGFLVHLSMTYPILAPYLKGLHLTVDSWRDGRDDEGWRMSRREIEAMLASRGDEAAEHIPLEPEAPEKVYPVPRLERDLLSLEALMESDQPAERVIRAKTTLHVVYGFGDASGTGFGSSLTRLKALESWGRLSPPSDPGTNGLRYRIGVWGKDTEDASSNYRELRNVVEALEDAEANGDLADAQVFFCTDNSVAEMAIYKGTSSSLTLYDLVLRLKKLEMRSGCQVLVSHVSGKRMIAQGTDGVSRGNLSEGVMAGRPMFEFLPFHLSATDRSPALLDWVKSWLGSDLELLTPEGWYERGHDFDGGRSNCDGIWIPGLRSGIFVWAPPPAAADAALEELRKARHKRQASTHVILVPRLMTAKWRKQLHKAADCVFEMPAGCGDAWPSEMFEPCLIGICFPFLKHRPWQLRGAPRLLALERTVRSMWESGDTDVAACLCQFLDKTRKLPSMPEDVVRKMLYV